MFKVIIELFSLPFYCKLVVYYGGRLPTKVNRGLACCGVDGVEDIDVGQYCPLAWPKLRTLLMDLVIPIPESGIVPALAVAESLGKPYRHAFFRNRYIFRIFIMSSQEKRRKGVQSKLSPLKSEFRGKNVLLIDDTCVIQSRWVEVWDWSLDRIVRGTTSLQVCNMARAAAARKVYFACTAPPVT